MLTVFGERDLLGLAERRQTAEKLLSFAGVKVSHDMLADAERSFGPVAAALRKALAARPRTPDAEADLDAVLGRELKSTKTLQAWPCKSLWVDKADPVLRAHAAALAPNCSTPFTTCSVGKDKSEMAGSGPNEP